MPKPGPEPAGAGDASDDDPFGLERLIFFSDAVFAIAITLLALDVRLPPGQANLSNAQLLVELAALRSKYLGFAISFWTIGAFWAAHHRRFRFIRRYDRRLVLLNLLLLMVIVFIPFPTSVISEYGNRTATVFYALTMAAAGLISVAIWWYAAYPARLTDPNLTASRRRQETVRPLILPAVFLLSAGLAFVNDDLARYSWLLLVPATLFYR